MLFLYVDCTPDDGNDIAITRAGNITIYSFRQSLQFETEQGSPNDGYIPSRFRTFCFSLNVEPDQNCTLPLVKNGKTGNTSWLIGNLNILGYMHIVSIRTTFVPS